MLHLAAWTAQASLTAGCGTAYVSITIHADGQEMFRG
jgi:hypothetical protein